MIYKPHIWYCKTQRQSISRCMKTVLLEHDLQPVRFWTLLWETITKMLKGWTFLHAHRRVCNVFFPFKMHCIECCSACSWGPRDLLEELAYKKNQTSRLLAKHGPSPQSRVSVQKQLREKKSVATWTSAFFSSLVKI